MLILSIYKSNEIILSMPECLVFLIDLRPSDYVHKDFMFIMQDNLFSVEMPYSSGSNKKGEKKLPIDSLYLFMQTAYDIQNMIKCKFIATAEVQLIWHSEDLRVSSFMHTCSLWTVMCICKLSFSVD